MCWGRQVCEAEDADARKPDRGADPRWPQKIEAAFRADMEIENQMVSGLSESERAELVRLLRKLTQAMRGDRALAMLVRDRNP
jgi:hypothetical protein